MLAPREPGTHRTAPACRPHGQVRPWASSRVRRLKGACVQEGLPLPLQAVPPPPRGVPGTALAPPASPSRRPRAIVLGLVSWGGGAASPRGEGHTVSGETEPPELGLRPWKASWGRRDVSRPGLCTLPSCVQPRPLRRGCARLGEGRPRPEAAGPRLPASPPTPCQPRPPEAPRPGA